MPEKSTRRATLAALGALLSAGCLGARRPESEQSMSTAEPTETPASTETPTETPTPTATPEPTETPEPTPTGDERDAEAEALTAVEDALVDAVEAFVGSADDFESVSAATTGFDETAAFLALRTVARRVASADDAVVSEEGSARLADLRVAETFLSTTTATQAAHVEAFEALDDLRASLDDDVDAAEAAMETFRTRVDGLDTYRDGLDGLDAGALDSTDALGDDAYGETVTRFDGEAAAFDDAESVVDNLVEGWDYLAEARADLDDDEEDDAVDAAEAATGKLDTAQDTFDDLRDDPPDGAEALTDVFEDLYERTETLYDAADDIVDDHD